MTVLNIITFSFPCARKPNQCFDGMTLDDGTAEVKKAQELWESCIPVSSLEQQNWDQLSYHLGIQVWGVYISSLAGVDKYL